MQKVECKIKTLENYKGGLDIDFTLPNKFSLNWFVSFSEGKYESLSKSTKSIKSGTVLNKRVLSLLSECEERRKNGNKQSQSKAKEHQNLIKSLRTELEITKRERNAQAEENIELRRQLIDTKRKVQIFRAQIRDQNTNRKILSMKNNES